VSENSEDGTYYYVELPIVDFVFDVLREIGTQVFSYKDFKNVASQYPELQGYTTHNLLRILFLLI
jgi:hypothetical protein